MSTEFLCCLTDVFRVILLLCGLLFPVEQRVGRWSLIQLRVGARLLCTVSRRYRDSQNRDSRILVSRNRVRVRELRVSYDCPDFDRPDVDCPSSRRVTVVRTLVLHQLSSSIIWCRLMGGDGLRLVR